MIEGQRGSEGEIEYVIQHVPATKKKKHHSSISLSLSPVSLSNSSSLSFFLLSFFLLSLLHLLSLDLSHFFLSIHFILPPPPSQSFWSILNFSSLGWLY